MKKSIICLIIICALTVYSAPSEVMRTVDEYQGYDELIQSINEISYHNTTYYHVDYSKNLAYSGSIIIDDRGELVRNKKTLVSFILADVIHKNYDNESADMWYDFAMYYESKSSAFDYMNDHLLANDSRDIAKLMKECGENVRLSIQSFDPQATEEYLDAESLVIAKMDESLDHMNETGAKDADYVRSTGNMREIIAKNREFMMSSSDYMVNMMEDRVKAEDNRYLKEGALVAASILLFLFVTFIKARGSSASKQGPPPLG